MPRELMDPTVSEDERRRRLAYFEDVPDFSDVNGGANSFEDIFKTAQPSRRGIEGPIGGDSMVGARGSAGGNAIEGNQLDWSLPGSSGPSSRPWFSREPEDQAAIEQEGRALASRYGAPVDLPRPITPPQPTRGGAGAASMGDGSKAPGGPPSSLPSLSDVASGRSASQPEPRGRALPNSSIRAIETPGGATTYTNRLGPDSLFGPGGSVGGSQISLTDPNPRFKGRGDIRADEYAGLRAHAFQPTRGERPIVPTNQRRFDEQGNALEHYSDYGGGKDIEGRLRTAEELAAPALQEAQIKAELAKNQRAIEDPYGIGQRSAEASIEAQKQGSIALSKAQADAYVARVKEAARYERSDQVLEDDLARQMDIINRAPAPEEAKAAARANELRKYAERKQQFARIGLAHGYPKSEFDYEDQPQVAPQPK